MRFETSEKGKLVLGWRHAFQLLQCTDPQLDWMVFLFHKQVVILLIILYVSLWISWWCIFLYGPALACWPWRTGVCNPFQMERGGLLGWPIPGPSDGHFFACMLWRRRPGPSQNPCWSLWQRWMVTLQLRLCWPPSTSDGRSRREAEVWTRGKWEQRQRHHGSEWSWM